MDGRTDIRTEFACGALLYTHEPIFCLFTSRMSPGDHENESFFLDVDSRDFLIFATFLPEINGEKKRGGWWWLEEWSVGGDGVEFGVGSARQLE